MQLQDCTLKIRLPTSCLILTRFAASFVAFCAVCYESVILCCPEVTSSGTLESDLICQNPVNIFFFFV